MNAPPRNSDSKPELVEMINCVTTNKTDFFREPHHFAFVQQKVLPLVQGRAIGALALWRMEARPFTDKETTLIQTFAEQAAIAIGHVHIGGQLALDQGERFGPFSAPQEPLDLIFPETDALD